MLYSNAYGGLGDCWVGVQWLIHNTSGSVELSSCCAKNQITNRQRWFSIKPKLLEILALLDGTSRIKLVDECGGHLLEPEVCCQAPVVPVIEKYRWRNRRSNIFAYHLSGLTDAARKNPPAQDVDRLLDWCGQKKLLPFDLHGDCYNLADIATILQMSDMFLGCCSGPAHIAHSVGVPIHLVHYARDPEKIRHWHEGRVFTLHHTIGDFINAPHPSNQQPPPAATQPRVPDGLA